MGGGELAHFVLTLPQKTSGTLGNLAGYDCLWGGGPLSFRTCVTGIFLWDVMNVYSPSSRKKLICTIFFFFFCRLFYLFEQIKKKKKLAAQYFH